MRKAQVFPYYRQLCEWYEEAYEIIKDNFTEGYAEELAALRGYVGYEQKQMIDSLELGHCSLLPEMLGEHARELGLLSKSGTFLLDDRFIIPVRDIKNNLVALIGYYPDAKKYITTPSPFFSKSNLLFNFRHAYDLSWQQYNGFAIVVEGIFDCLSLRSLGLPAVSVMGASLSKSQGELLKLFRKVLAIPDNDTIGRKSLYKWNVPSNTTMLKLIGGFIEVNGVELPVKDMDNFVSWYDANDVKETLLSYMSSRETIEELIL